MFRVSIHKHFIPFYTGKLAMHIDYREILITCKLNSSKPNHIWIIPELRSSSRPEYSWHSPQPHQLYLTKGPQDWSHCSFINHCQRPEHWNPQPVWAVSQPCSHSCFIFLNLFFGLNIFFLALFLACITICHTTYFFLSVELDSTHAPYGQGFLLTLYPQFLGVPGS